MPTQMVVLTVPLWFLLLLGYVWGMMVLLLVQYVASGHRLLTRNPTEMVECEP